MHEVCHFVFSFSLVINSSHWIEIVPFKGLPRANANTTAGLWEGYRSSRNRYVKSSYFISHVIRLK